MLRKLRHGLGARRWLLVAMAVVTAAVLTGAASSMAQTPATPAAKLAAAQDPGVVTPKQGEGDKSKPSAATPDCSSASYNDLLGQTTAVAKGFVVPASGILPSQAATMFTYLHPKDAASDHLEFRAFLAPQGEKNAKSSEIPLLQVVHPVADPSDDAKGAGATADNAYGLKVKINDGDSLKLIDHHWLFVVACQKLPATSAGATATNRLVSFAALPVRVSDKTGAGLTAFGIMVVVYCIAALLRFLAGQTTRAAKAQLSERFSGAGARPVRVSNQGVQIPWWQCFDPVVLSADIFSRASLSQLQVLIFLMLVGYGVSYSLLRTGTLSELSPSIVFLLGIPAAGALGNTAVNTTRDRFTADNWAWLVSHHVLTVDDPGTDKPKWRDVLTTGSKVDLYKLQAFTFSIIVGVAMIYSGFTNLESFKVPDTLLQILGLSQVVFVGGRLTQPTSVGDADSLVTELRKRAGDLKVAATTGVDVDSNGKPLGVPSPGAGLNVVASMADAQKFAPNAATRYAELANEVTILLKGLTYRDVVTDRLEDPFTWGQPTLSAPAATPPGAPPPAPAPVAPPAAPAAAQGPAKAP
ncbi:hypothetical protein [Phenylobacterium sp.]|uniref:hypothetical protein n=1 Tax=Phenylobacterium sp. TaxID=1871053 RepID=UPI002D17033E|nr:hypothetical protein [Phenylobacterium sp.]HLZ77186.1 hypothetical protein [Phenylobacterium sp.]